MTAGIKQKTLDAVRNNFDDTIILCNGLTPTAEEAINNGSVDIVAFGRSFLANPDLDKRIAGNAVLNGPDYKTFYTPGPIGYTGYPALKTAKQYKPQKELLHVRSAINSHCVKCYLRETV
ncbi:MAG: hypothetical protein ABIQ31_02730 [Ferruginibacter sp.]